MSAAAQRKRWQGSFGLALIVLVATRFWCLVPSFTLALVPHAHCALKRQPLSSRAALPTRRAVDTARDGPAGVELITGDRVKALSPDDTWHFGEIVTSNSDGTVVVAWDDPDGGPETETMELEYLQKLDILNYTVGDDCEAKALEDGRWYPGVVTAINRDGTYTVRWDDPGNGPETEVLEPKRMTKKNFFKAYKEGDCVEAVFPDDGQWYPGTIGAAVADGTFVVIWDDQLDGEKQSQLSPKQMRWRATPIEKLRVGGKYTGKVLKLMRWGAFVDIGAEVNCILHISKISKEPFKSIREHLKEGQEITVWVFDAIADTGKVSLTMIEGLTGFTPRAEDSDYKAFKDISPDEWLQGKVQRLLDSGAVVRVKSRNGAEATGRLYKSQVEGQIMTRNMSDVLRVGQTVRVRIQSLDLKSGILSLTMLRGASGGFVRKPSTNIAAFAALPADQWLDGEVMRIAHFGAFVRIELDNGNLAEGLVHITNIKDGFVQAVAMELDVGQAVKVRVVSVDVLANRISLSMI